MSTKWVYDFSEGRADQNKLLGNKGANLCELVHLGINTPPGFIISAEACRSFLAGDGSLDKEIWNEILNHLHGLERETGLKFGNEKLPLLVSVRSGSSVSMPGMMDTLINVGLTEQIAGNIEIQLAYPTAAAKIIEKLHTGFRKGGIQKIPPDPLEQLRAAIMLVFSSWNNDRAVQYRRERRIPDSLCTAAVIQQMVFGIGQNSGTGVFFTQDPVLGMNEPTGDWLPNAFGEELVSGENKQKPYKLEYLKETQPKVYQELVQNGRKLQTYFGYVQDIEYTIENSNVWFLQCRKGILSLYAEAEVVHNMVAQGDITRREAIKRIDIGQLDNIRNFTIFEQEALKAALETGSLLGVGLNPSFGATTGRLAISQTSALQYLNEGNKVVFVAEEADTDNLFRIMRQVNGILTQKGGATSHAALVARGLGKPCVVGCGAMSIDYDTKKVVFGKNTLSEGDTVSLDAWSGQVFRGEITIIKRSEDVGAINTIEQWAKEFSAPSIWASADYRYDVHPAKRLSDRIYKLWFESPFKSDKAKSASIRSVIPDKHNIVMRPIPAKDASLLKNTLLKIVNDGEFWAGVRTGLSPQPLGNSPWVMGLKTTKDVENFMKNEYQEWRNRKFTVSREVSAGKYVDEPAELTELIVVSNPPYLGLSDHNHEHFVFRVNCQNGVITLEANLHTAQLRSIEKNVKRSELVRIECKLDYREIGELFYPHAKVAFGSKYFSAASMEELIAIVPRVPRDIGLYHAITSLSPIEYLAYRLVNIFPGLDTSDIELFKQRCTDLMEIEDVPKSVLKAIVDHRAYNTVEGIVKHVFEYWWDRNVLDLPYMMWAFDIALGLHILEAQGRMTENGDIEYIRVYDVRGREEKQESQRAQQSSFDLRH